MKKIIRQKSGVCPKCGKNNLDYGETEWLEGSIGYTFVCQDCGCEGIEWYDLNYTDSEIRRK